MVVARAPAEIPRHACADLIGSRTRIAREQAFGTHQLPRCAEPALWSVMSNECLLQWVQTAVPRQAFDRLYRTAIRPYGQIAAGVHRLSVQKHRACSAFAAIASNFRTGES